MQFLRPPAPYDDLEPAVAADEIARTGALLVDVRETYEFAAGHAAGAVHIPLGQLASRAGELAGRRVLVICAHGNRSRTGATILVRAGLSAANVHGGTAAWMAAGLPMER